MKVVILCRGCGARSADSAVDARSSNVRFLVEHKHGPGCSLLKALRNHEEAEMDWILVRVRPRSQQGVS